jgi:hypothetical protein
MNAIFWIYRTRTTNAIVQFYFNLDLLDLKSIFLVSDTMSYKNNDWRNVSEELVEFAEDMTRLTCSASMKYSK